MALYDGRIRAEVYGECKTCGERVHLGNGPVIKLSWAACKAQLIKRGWKLLNFSRFQCPACQKAAPGREEARRRGETVTEVRRRGDGATEVGHLDQSGKWVPELTMSLVDGYWTPVASTPTPTVGPEPRAPVTAPAGYVGRDGMWEPAVTVALIDGSGRSSTFTPRIQLLRADEPGDCADRCGRNVYTYDPTTGETLCHECAHQRAHPVGG